MIRSYQTIYYKILRNPTFTKNFHSVFTEIFVHLEPHIVNSHASIVLLHTNNALTLVPTRVSESGPFEVTGKLLLH